MTALDKLKAAVNRLDYYGAPSDESPVMVDANNTLYELLDKSEGLGHDMQDAKPLTLGDFRQLIQELE